MIKSFYFFLFIISGSLLSTMCVAHSGNVVVEVEGLRSQTGNVECYLFHQADGYPRNRDRALRKWVVAVQPNQPIRIEIDSLVAGEYAISLLHDENGNGKVDKNLIGMPKEGMGASNNPKSSFGPPKFEQAKFRVETKKTNYLKIKMTYL